MESPGLRQHKALFSNKLQLGANSEEASNQLEYLASAAPDNNSGTKHQHEVDSQNSGSESSHSPHVL